MTSFIPDAHALGTADDTELARAASTFGVSYDVSTDSSGEPAVAHTTLLYAVDDTGHVVLAWPFGVSKDDLAADIGQLLDQQPASGVLVNRLAVALATGIVVVAVPSAAFADAAKPSDFRSEIVSVLPADRRHHSDDRGRRLVRTDRGRARPRRRRRGLRRRAVPVDRRRRCRAREPALAGHVLQPQPRRRAPRCRRRPTPTATPDWKVVGHGGAYAWHDHRAALDGWRPARPTCSRGTRCHRRSCR